MEKKEEEERGRESKEEREGRAMLKVWWKVKIFQPAPAVSHLETWRAYNFYSVSSLDPVVLKAKQDKYSEILMFLLESGVKKTLLL